MRLGSTIGGYRIVEKIGSGGMSVVYRAIDADGRDVALKLLHPELAVDPRARQRLRREVAMLQRVKGPYMAQILDAETDEEEIFIVTELIEGPTLDRDVRESGRYEGGDLLELGQELSAALESIHHAGVLHRDLKPSNVMMGADGPVLIDFGIAQLGDDLRMTQTGSLTHTPGFCDPRVIRGQDPDVDADWWALAAVLAYAATGRAPFGVGNSPAVMHRVITGDAQLDGLPAGVARAFRAALSPRLEGRLNFADLLGALATGEASGGFGGAREATSYTDSYELAGASDQYTQVWEEPVTQHTQVWDESAQDALAENVGATRPIVTGGSFATAPYGVGDLDQTGQMTTPYSLDPTRQQAYPGPALPPAVHEPPNTANMPTFDPGRGGHQDVERGHPASVAPGGPQRTSIFDRPAFSQPPAPIAGDAAQPDALSGPYAPGQAFPAWYKPPRKARLQVLAVGVVVVLFALAWPVAAAAAAGALILAVSWLGGAQADLKERRARRGGPYRNDVVGAFARSPLTLLGAALRTLVSLAVGASLGWATLTGLGLFATFTTPVANAVGVGVGLVVAWLMGTNANGREGARYVMESIAPSAGYRLFWLAITLVVSMAAVVVVSQSGVKLF